ncbi:MAG TPA: DUF262 domain-containing HNH endonuclease family protein [Verrucomicrobiae bacterium]|nr:DUF262 domain-containing HNH endonuclease family protein [Verrucomicrobiae bacterium]
MAKPGHDIVSINDILSGSIAYRVPKYQRGYAWDETNFEELWEDINNKALKGSDLFMGSIIIFHSTSNPSDAREIVDGQQRLVTFTILLRVLSDQLSEEKDQERFRRDLYRLMGSDDGNHYKLTLGDADEDFFHRFIKKQDREASRRGLKKSHKMIRVAYELFEEKIIKEVKSGKYESKVDLIDQIFEAIKQRTQLLEITVGDEFDAYAIFESINAKRVDLTPAELIKNYVFSAVSRSEAELNKVRQDWEDALGKLSPSNKEIGITTYIRHYWISTIADVREKELYRAIKTQYSNSPSSIPNFVTELSDNSANYAAIVYPEIVRQTDEGLDVLRVQNINRFNFKQTYPLLLSTLGKKPNQDTFDEIISILETTILRRSIRGSNPNELEETLSTCSRLMNQEGKSALNAIKSALKALTPSDGIVKSELMNSTYTPNSKIILEEYEISVSTGEKSIKNPTIEHITPQTPLDYASWGVGIEEHEHWLNNIGNLTLLGRPLNSSASNVPFSSKKKCL